MSNCYCLPGKAGGSPGVLAMSASELLPTLQLLPVAQVRLHEHPERKRMLGSVRKSSVIGRLKQATQGRIKTSHFE